MNSFATVQDVTELWRLLTEDEQERVRQLLPVVSDSLRQEARNVGKDLDLMIASGAVLLNVVKSVTVDIIARTIMTPTNQTPMSQISETGLGYTMQGTFLVPGGGLFIKKSELARLGLRRQRIGAIEFYGNAAQGNNCPASD